MSKETSTVLSEPLTRLPPAARLAFAAACGERLIASYGDFATKEGWGDPGSIREALDAAWDVAAGVELPEAKLAQLVARCESLIPRAEDFGSSLAELAEDAASAVMYILQCAIDGDSGKALHASECLMEAIDVIEYEGTETKDPNKRTVSLAAGLAWQRRDLQELTKHADGNIDARFINGLRRRAAAQSVKLPPEGLSPATDSHQSELSERFLRELRNLSAADKPVIEKRWRERFETPDPVVMAAKRAAARALGVRKFHDALDEAGSAVGARPGSPIRRAAGEAAIAVSARDQISPEDYNILVDHFATVMPWLKKSVS